jgi:hypothetical protein
MFKQGRHTWRNRLIWMLIISVLVISPLSVISVHGQDRSALSPQSPISISAYFRDYALIFAHVRMDSKTNKLKGNGIPATKFTLSENKRIAFNLLPRQSSFYRNILTTSICFANIESTFQGWSGYACSLLDLPPPTPNVLATPV